MRRKDKEITNSEVLEDILNNAEICRLGLVDIDEAYIVPVNFAYFEGSVFIHSATQGRKLEIIKHNNKVTFEVEGHTSIVKGTQPCNWTAKYRSVMGKGIIHIEVNSELKKKALDRIMKKYGWGDDVLIYDEALLSRVCILKLDIKTLSGKQSGDW